MFVVTLLLSLTTLDIIPAVVGSVIVATFALGFTWLGLAGAYTIYSTFLASPLQWRNRALSRRRQAKQQEAREREERERRSREAEHERETKLAAAQDESRRQSEQTRCERVVFETQLLYDSLCPAVAEVLPREQFENYLGTHFSTDSGADEVEYRGKQLREKLIELTTRHHPVTDSLTLESLAQWFVQQRDRIDKLPVDDRLRDQLRAGLHYRYAELTEQLMERLRP